MTSIIDSCVILSRFAHSRSQSRFAWRIYRPLGYWHSWGYLEVQCPSPWSLTFLASTWSA